MLFAACSCSHSAARSFSHPAKKTEPGHNNGNGSTENLPGHYMINGSRLSIAPQARRGDESAEG
jgi:CMP-N-acetylneuraminic acid synthetase